MKYFGTDGIRNTADFFMVDNFLFRVAKAIRNVFGTKKVVIGRDTRVSGEAMLQRLCRAFCDLGVEVFDLGIVPTPEVCYYTKELEGAVGVMISASHNPPEYNGIKVISSTGAKIAQHEEVALEKEIDNLIMTLEIRFAEYHEIDGAQDYINRMTKDKSLPLQGRRILIDCANGSASLVAKPIFTALGAIVDSICDQADGSRINCGSGAAHIDNIANLSREYDFALAFDGDADRVLGACDGRVIDGDDIIYAIALKENVRVVAVTVMSNCGLDKALNARKVDVIRVAVGDKFVQDAVISGRADMGAEQSGHIIFSQEYCTGDGILGGIEYLKSLEYVRMNLFKPTELLSGALAEIGFCKYAQRLLSVHAEKSCLDNVDYSDIEAKVKADGGRVVVRPSGTEQLLRVLVEAREQSSADEYASEIIKRIYQCSSSI